LATAGLCPEGSGETPARASTACPLQQGPTKAVQAWVLAPKTSSSPCCCAWGGGIGSQPPAQMYPGTELTAGLALGAAVVSGGTWKSLLITALYKQLLRCSLFSRDVELSLAASDVGPVPVGAPGCTPPEW